MSPPSGRRHARADSAGPRSSATPVRRAARPAALLAVLLLLFLPFATISCTAPVAVSEKLEVNFSGWDSAVGTDPTIQRVDKAARASSGGAETIDSRPRPTPEQRMLRRLQLLLGGGFVAVVGLGAVATAALRSSRARSLAGFIAAVVAGAALVANQLALRAYVFSSLDETDRELRRVVAVETRWGAPLTLTYLILFATANTFLYVSSAPDEPEASDVPEASEDPIPDREAPSRIDHLQ